MPLCVNLGNTVDIPPQPFLINHLATLQIIVSEPQSSQVDFHLLLCLWLTMSKENSLITHYVCMDSLMVFILYYNAHYHCRTQASYLLIL